MEIILVRHGEADYSQVDRKGYLGFGRDLAPLSANGIRQAYEASREQIFSGAQLVISSPYTRALQTAAIISKALGLELAVEVGLHERLPDTRNELRTKGALEASFKEYDAYRGIPAEGRAYPWESICQQTDRIKESLDKYCHHKKIIVVTHGELIRRLAPGRLPFCGTVQIEYGEGYPYLGWS